MATSNPTNQLKRKRPDDLDLGPEPENEHWPRFLVIESTDPDHSILKMSPFAIEKGIQGVAGEPKSVKKTGNILLVELTRKSHSDNLLKCNMLATVPVKVSAHRTLNFRKGVIRCADLADCDEDTIVEELSDQLVTAARRIYIRRDGSRLPTNSIILTFGTAVLPEKIKVGYLVVRVKPFIPNPLRCFRCQRYGHGIDKCRGKVTCSRCSGEHDSEACSEQPHCANCDENHPSTDRNCSKFLFEKEVQKVKFTENISYPEARRKVSNSNQVTNAPNNYAKAVTNKPTVATVGTQTSITWPFNQLTYSVVNDPVKTSNSSQTETTIDSQSAVSTVMPPAQKPPSKGPSAGGQKSDKSSTNENRKPNTNIGRNNKSQNNTQNKPQNKPQSKLPTRLNNRSSSQEDMDTSSGDTKGSPGDQRKTPVSTDRNRSRSPITYKNK